MRIDLSMLSFLKFFIHLKENRQLSTRTLMNYRVYLSQPILLALEVYLNDWEFRDLDKAFFLQEPRKLKHIPKWNPDKVL